MDAWVRFDTDRGAVLWSIMCCVLAVLANFALIARHVSIFCIVPFDLFGVPLLVTAAFWMMARRRK